MKTIAIILLSLCGVSAAQTSLHVAPIDQARDINARLYKAWSTYDTDHRRGHTKRAVEVPAVRAQVKSEESDRLARYEKELAPILAEARDLRAKLIAGQIETAEDLKFDDLLESARPAKLADSGFGGYLERLAAR